MPCTYKDYTLYTREVNLRGGRTQRIYYFSKGTPKSGEPCDLPDGYKICENPKTGFAYIKKK